MSIRSLQYYPHRQARQATSRTTSLHEPRAPSPTPISSLGHLRHRRYKISKMRKSYLSTMSKTIHPMRFPSLFFYERFLVRRLQPRLQRATSSRHTSERGMFSYGLVRHIHLSKSTSRTLQRRKTSQTIITINLQDRHPVFHKDVLRVRSS